MTDTPPSGQITGNDKPSVVFMGSPEFSLPSLHLLAKKYTLKAVYTQPPRKSGRGMKLELTAVGKAASQLSLTCCWPETLKGKAVQDQLNSFAADFFVVVAYGLILPQAVLDMPEYGCVNGHASLLPRWRGAAPIQRAIEDGDPYTGISTMLMQKSLDTGPVIDSCRIKIAADMTAGKLHDILAVKTAELLCVTIDKLWSGQAKPIAQPETGVCYAHKISTKDRQLDPSQQANLLQRKINAYSPHPGAFFQTAFGRLKILRAQACPPVDPTLSAGCFAGLSQKKGLVVSCGEQTALEIYTLQADGKQAMSAQAWLNGHPLTFGQSLLD